MGFGIGSISSALSSVGSFFGSSGGSAIAQAVLNNYFNKKAASKQYGYTKSLIDYENAYNLPVNQRARLEEAGYNPNLALNGVNVQSATGSAPQVKPALVDMLGAYNLEQQNRLLGKQVDLTDENINNARILGLLNGRKANIAYYNDKYAEAEYEIFKKTGKIPASYYKSDWQSELTSLLKGLAARFGLDKYISRYL